MREIVRNWKVFVPLLLLVALLYLHWPQKYLHVFEQHYRPNSAPEHRQLHVSSDSSLARDSTNPIANDSVGAELVFEESKAFSDNHNDPSETEQPHHKGKQFLSEENKRPDSPASATTPSNPVTAVDSTSSVSAGVEPTEGEGEATPISLSTDIDKRGEWQRQQVEAYCRKYNLTKVEYEFPEDLSNRLRLFRHLLTDDKRKILFAFVPKAGCTNTRRFFHLMGEVLPKKARNIVKMDHYFQANFMDPAIEKTSFLRHVLSDMERKHIVKTYYKYTIVRHPLERMVSGYRDKIEPPLVHGRNISMDRMQLPIVERFQADEYKQWQQSGFSFPMKIPFHVYARWVIEIRDMYLNEHFEPVIANIYPCRIKYDFYGNFKQLVTDMRAIADKFHVPHDYIMEHGYHHPGEKTQELVQSYFTLLDEDMRRKVFQEFYQDLDFYYHLYPEERNSHCQMLGIDDLVV